VSVEHEIGWAPFFINLMDYSYTQRARLPDWPRFKNDALPSDLFRKHVLLSFQEDALGIRLRHDVGVDNLMWGSDYPHPESTFPRSREILERVLADVPDDERARMVCGNAAKLYGFKVPAPAPPAPSTPSRRSS
jgi:predicted TIM-barrel fold metal-dependent hydrolase